MDPEGGGEGEAWCAERGLLDRDTCSDVAKHCNERKLAAKAVQASVVLPPLQTLAGCPCVMGLL